MVKNGEIIYFEKEDLAKITYDDMGIYGGGEVTTLYFTAPITLLPFYNEEQYISCEECEISLTIREDITLCRMSPTLDGSDYDWNDVILSLESINALLAKAICRLASYEEVKIC